MRPLPLLDQVLTRAALAARTPGYRWERATQSVLAGDVGAIEALTDREGIVGRIGPSEVLAWLEVVDGALVTRCSSEHKTNPHRCHHAAAVGLAYLARRAGSDEEGLTAPRDMAHELRDALAHLSRDALAQVLLDCAALDPGLADRLILLHRGHGPTTSDLRAYRGALERALPSPGDGPHRPDASAVLRHAEHFVSALEDLSSAGHHAAVLTLCALAAPRLEAAYSWSPRYDHEIAGLQDRLAAVEQAARGAEARVPPDVTS